MTVITQPVSISQEYLIMTSSLRHRTVATTILILSLFCGVSFAQEITVGLQKYEASSFEGYTLFNQMASGTAHLIDNYGRLVHKWSTEYPPAVAVYLLPNGDLLRTTRFPDEINGLQQLDWDGAVIWEYEFTGENFRQHHDIQPLPNGNVLILAREHKSIAEAIQEGRDPALLTGDDLETEFVVEVMPTGPTTGEIVWEWHLWDHMIQDFDSTKNNFGDVRAHPELMDINYATSGSPDWLHANSVSYNPDLDQIIISCRSISEIWVIDHSTSTAEAAGHAGGSSGKGGDILYRWGNPQVYRMGTEDDRQLYLQHDARWIPTGYPGQGNIMVFNNGERGGDREFSSVDEIIPPTDGNGNYLRGIDQPFGPSTPVWSYTADIPEDFFAFFISGAHRLPNGNTLICSGPQGRFFEVTPAREIVWEYINPITFNGPVSQGENPGGNLVFRCTRYAPDFDAFDDRPLDASGTLELYPVEIIATAHYPSSPISGQSIAVASEIQSDISIAFAEVFVDTGDGYYSVPMFDDGHHQDSVYNDDFYGAVIGMLPEGTTASYYVHAVDDSGNVTFDPPIAPDVAYTFSVSSGELLIGDVDGSGGIDIDDIVFEINYVFSGGEAPNPIEVGDVNCSGGIDIDDVVYLIEYVFSSGPEPCEGLL